MKWRHKLIRWLSRGDGIMMNLEIYDNHVRSLNLGHLLINNLDVTTHYPLNGSSGILMDPLAMNGVQPAGLALTVDIMGDVPLTIDGLTIYNHAPDQPFRRRDLPFKGN